jgi:predicted GIY-YIG superfamily endonuclease
MKQPKDGYYTVYLLPREWYVGMTGNIKERLITHKNSLGKNTSHWTELAEVYTKEEALEIEAHYHSIGYKGKQNTDEAILKRVAKIDYKSQSLKRVANTDFEKVSIKRVANTDYDAFQEKRVANTDYKAFQEKRVANTDYDAFQKKRVANTDFKAISVKRVANTNWEEKAKNSMKPIIQLSLNGEFIKEWDGIKEASLVLGIGNTCISSCCRGKKEKVGGYKWEYKKYET